MSKARDIEIRTKPDFESQRYVKNQVTTKIQFKVGKLTITIMPGIYTKHLLV